MTFIWNQFFRLCFNLVFNPCHTGNTGNTDTGTLTHWHTGNMLTLIWISPYICSSGLCPSKSQRMIQLRFDMAVNDQVSSETGNSEGGKLVNLCKMYFPGSKLSHVDFNIQIFVLFFLWITWVKLKWGWVQISHPNKYQLAPHPIQRKPNNFIS